MVLKHDGRREEFSKDKLLSGIRKACQKRPISPKAIEDLVERIVNEVTDKYEREVPAEVIGKLVMDATARTFRYLDEEEVAAQKKAAREKDSKKKGGPAKKPAANAK